MRIALTFQGGPRAGETLEFFEGPVRLGSAAEIEVSVGGAEAAEVDAAHAHIAFECGLFVLYGAGGARGTYLNGRRVSVAKLKSGDRIRLGERGPTLRFEGEAGFGGYLDLLTTSCRVNARMMQAVVQDSLREARSRKRGAAVTFVQEVIRRSRWQLGARIALMILAFFLAAGAGAWWLLRTERAEVATLAQRLHAVEEQSRRREIAIVRSNEAFLQSAQAQERVLRHQIDALTRELGEARTLSKTVAEGLREQVRILSEELGRTRKAILAERSGQFIEVARENQRGVVWVVHTWALISKKTGRPLFLRGRDPEGNPVIEEVPEGPQAALSAQTASGSGFAVSAQGRILTNRHLARPWEYLPPLARAEITGRTVRLFVVFADQKAEIPARALRVSERADVAVLAVEPFPDLPHLGRLNPSSGAAQQGTAVAVIGFPMTAVLDGLARTTLTTGVLSKPPLEDSLQFDASINPGNSGGPILNAEGEVIGIVEATAATQEGERLHGISFGVPIRFAMDLLRELPGS